MCGSITGLHPLLIGVLNDNPVHIYDFFIQHNRQITLCGKDVSHHDILAKYSNFI